MLYNPGILWIAANAKNYPFTVRRWLRLPDRYHLGFLGEFPNVLRDASPQPHLYDGDLKPEFYFTEFVH